MTRALATVLLAFAAIIALYAATIRPGDKPLLIDAAYHPASGAWCDVTPQSQAEPVERPRGVIKGRVTPSGDIA